MTDDRIYPCDHPGCTTMRTKAEGGTTFTVCEAHWKVRTDDRQLADEMEKIRQDGVGAWTDRDAERNCFLRRDKRRWEHD